MRARLLLLAAALGACSGGATRELPAHPPRVRVLAVQPRPLRPSVQVAGVLAPLPGKDVKVGSLVQGRVERVLVAEGDAVKVGQVLAHIEAQPLREHLTETEAQKDQAKAQLENARTRLARTEKLWKDGIAARQEVDDARAQLAAAESALKQAQASGGIATVQLDRATLRSPIAGVVAAILVPAGQPVDGSATPVVEIADTRVLDLRAPIAAGRVGELHVGDRAELTVDGVGAITGAIEAIAPLVDPQTGAVTVRVKVPNDAGRLRGGQFARGAVLAPERTGLAVPRGALLPGDGGAATVVAIVGADGKVQHRALALGADAGDDVEVRAGLAAGDRVIVAGGYALPDGAEVEVAE